MKTSHLKKLLALASLLALIAAAPVSAAHTASASLPGSGFAPVEFTNPPPSLPMTPRPGTPPNDGAH